MFVTTHILDLSSICIFNKLPKQYKQQQGALSSLVAHEM